MLITKITRDEWMTAIGDAARPCDPDALTIREISDAMRMGQRSVNRHISRLLAEGRVIETSKMVRGRQGERRVAAFVIATPKAARRSS